MLIIVLLCLDDFIEFRLVFFYLVKIWDWSKNYNYLFKNIKEKKLLIKVILIIEL